MVLNMLFLRQTLLTMVHILEGEWDVPWSVALEVNDIRRLRGVVSARVKHSFREGNTLADFFTNLVFSFAGDFQINHFRDIPSTSKGRQLLNLDKQGTPYIRRQIQEYK